jgi:hypothetical protein
VIEDVDESDSESKKKAKSSQPSHKALERQLTYGDFIEMCDLEERYSREIYGHHTYADYIVKHKEIVTEIKKKYRCWMIGLRYHLAVRTVIFRRRKLVKTKVNGKTVIQDGIKIPNGLQPLVEQTARQDADIAGDTRFEDNPYAPGHPKFGFSFVSGKEKVKLPIESSAEKASDQSYPPSSNQRGKRGGGGRKPYVKKNNYSRNRNFKQGTNNNEG